MAGSVVFGVLIRMHDSQTLVILRVVLLDGLFLVMGITLGVCIIVVSIGRRRTLVIIEGQPTWDRKEKLDIYRNSDATWIRPAI